MCLDVQTDCIHYTTHACCNKGQFSDPMNLTPNAKPLWVAAGCNTSYLLMRPPLLQINLISSHPQAFHSFTSLTRSSSWRVTPNSLDLCCMKTPSPYMQLWTTMHPMILCHKYQGMVYSNPQYHHHLCELHPSLHGNHHQDCILHSNQYQFIQSYYNFHPHQAHPSLWCQKFHMDQLCLISSILETREIS